MNFAEEQRRTGLDGATERDDSGYVIRFSSRDKRYFFRTLKGVVDGRDFHSDDFNLIMCVDADYFCELLAEFIGYLSARRKSQVGWYFHAITSDDTPYTSSVSSFCTSCVLSQPERCRADLKYVKSQHVQQMTIKHLQERIQTRNSYCGLCCLPLWMFTANKSVRTCVLETLVWRRPIGPPSLNPTESCDSSLSETSNFFPEWDSTRSDDEERFYLATPSDDERAANDNNNNEASAENREEARDQQVPQ